MRTLGTASEELTRITDVLLDERSAVGGLEVASEELFRCLSAPIGAVLDAASRASTMLWCGVAISPFDAAACTRDPIRTAVLLRGVDAALREALLRFPEEPLEVVYAGSGPLASLVLPLLPRFENATIRLSIIDVHEAALEAVQEIVDAFGFSPFVERLVCGDATAYRHPVPAHVVICETMQRALTREPQVAITRQLAPQLRPGGILVPERIRVDLAIGSPPGQDGDPAAHPRLHVQTLLDLRRESAELPVDAEGSLPAVRVILPQQRFSADAVAMECTTVTAFGHHILSAGQSGLTEPEIVWGLPVEPGRVVEFRYQLGPSPGFRWRAANGG